MTFPLVQACQMDCMTTLQEHCGVGTLRNVRVAYGARVVPRQPTHALMGPVLGHTHTALAAVHVVLAFSHAAYATVRTMEDILRLVVLPQMARLAVVVVLASVHCTLWVRTARTDLLEALAEHTLHVSHAESVKLGRFLLLVVAVPACDGLQGKRVNGFEPVFVV